MAQKLIDVTGNRYGRLTVLGFSHMGARRRSYWLCKCDCGNEIILRKDNFAYDYSHTKSCGCLKTEASRERMNANRNPITGRIEKREVVV